MRIKSKANSVVKGCVSCAMVLISLLGYAQEITPSRSDRIADCFGAVKLPNNGNFSIDFPEEPGVYLDLDNYKNQLTDIPQKNSIWLKFNPEFEGNFSATITVPENNCHLIIFDALRENACEAILKVEAEVLLDTVINQGEFNIENKKALNKRDPQSALYFYFNYTEKHRKKLRITSHFQALDFENASAALLNEVDQRFDKTQPTYTLSFRDSETRLPVDATAIIKDSRMFDAMYSGTDLLFSLDKTPKFSLRLDAIGYFPLDTNLRVNSLETTHHEIFLEPIAPGKQLSLEGIEFQPESANFVEGSQKKLTRVRDFLALNSDLRIEVQGHVYQLGDNNFRSSRLSKLRAKAVADYLINAGIGEERIEYKGYGNTVMIFPEPENDAEMQANRRVEIHIK